MALTENERQFLLSLRELSLKHGITIGGCGCCGSPWLDGDRLIDSQGAYQYDESAGDQLDWIEPPGTNTSAYKTGEWQKAIERKTIALPDSTAP